MKLETQAARNASPPIQTSAHDATAPSSWHTAMQDLELLLTGFIMAATIRPLPIALDAEEDFALWCHSWDIVRPAWDAATRERGWMTVGLKWEFHSRW